MSEMKIFPVPAEFAAQANVNAEQYAAMYQQSVDDPAAFWGEQAEKYLAGQRSGIPYSTGALAQMTCTLTGSKAVNSTFPITALTVTSTPVATK
jgi:hypothetical protein